MTPHASILSLSLFVNLCMCDICCGGRVPVKGRCGDNFWHGCLCELNDLKMYVESQQGSVRTMLLWVVVDLSEMINLVVLGFNDQMKPRFEGPQGIWI